MDMKSVITVVGWLIVASLVVLLIMNAGNTAQVISAGSNAVTSESALLTGSGYQKS